MSMPKFEFSENCESTWMQFCPMLKSEIVSAFDQPDHWETTRAPGDLGFGFNAITRIGSNSALLISGFTIPDLRGGAINLIEAVIFLDDISGVALPPEQKGDPAALLNASFDFLTDHIAHPFSLSPQDLPKLRQRPFDVNERVDMNSFDRFALSGDRLFTTTYIHNGHQVSSQFSYSKYANWREKQSKSLDLTRLERVRSSQHLLPKNDQKTKPSQLLLSMCNDLTEMIDCEATAEEDVHQWLFHPARQIFLDLDAETVRSKIPFGKSISDFVVQKSDKTYLLIEIESPRTPLVAPSTGEISGKIQHAITQTKDWKQYIRRNLRTVEHELELPGIYEPELLVIAGRNSCLKIERAMDRWRTVQSEREPRLSTYDDAIARVRNLADRFERLE